jgi:hypothetical protein
MERQEPLGATRWLQADIYHLQPSAKECRSETAWVDTFGSVGLCRLKNVSLSLPAESLEWPSLHLNGTYTKLVSMSFPEQLRSLPVRMKNIPFINENLAPDSNEGDIFSRHS